MEIISLGSFPKDLWVKCLDRFIQVWDKAGSTVVEKMKVDGIIYFEKYVLTSATC